MTLTASTRGLGGLAAVAMQLALATQPALAQPEPAPAQHAPPTRANLNITPKRLILDRAKRTASVYIFNQGNVPVTADITIVDRVMLPDGQIKSLSDAQTRPDLKSHSDRIKSAREFIMVAPRRITLMPGKGQTARLRAVVPPGADAPEYRSHFTVVTVPPRSAGLTAENAAASRAGELAIQINAVFGLSIPVIMRNGPADVRAEIRDVRLIEDRASPSNAASPALSFDLARRGSNSLYGTVQVSSSTGRKEVLGVARGVGVYPEIDSRKIRLLLQRAPARGEMLDVQFIDDDVTPGRVLARQSFTAN